MTERDDLVTKCDNCGEEIDGPAYANPHEPSENLCGHCYGVIKNGE